MGDNPLFRKAALDKLSSPERLDVLMQVTSPKGWLALATMAALLAGVIGWSIVGSIPTRLEGQGMLIRGTLRPIVATTSGILQEFTLKSDGTVAAGDLIGRVRMTEEDIKKGAAQAELDGLRVSAQNTEREMRVTQAGFNSQIQGTEEEIRRTRELLARNESLLEGRRASLKAGLTTQNQVIAAENDVESTKVRVTSLENQIRGSRAQIATLEQQIRSGWNRYNEAKIRFDAQAKGVIVESEIKSEVAGRVIELRVERGAAVKAGQELAIVQPEGEATQTKIYFDSRTARQIQKGMEAQISPTEIRREEFGYILGKVSRVGDAPVSLEKMRVDLANQALAQELFGKITPIEVNADLELGSTTSGFKWSTSGGPPFQISGNSRINVAVVVERRKPYTYILPMVKSALGGS